MKKSSNYKKNMLMGTLGLTIGTILTIIFSPLGNIYVFELINILLGATSMKLVMSLIACKIEIEVLEQQPSIIKSEEAPVIATPPLSRHTRQIEKLKDFKNEITCFQPNDERAIRPKELLIK